MVKLTGPMMSIAASGKFADTMVFARKGGTAYARQRVIPFNPQSASQTGFRAIFKFLSQAWASMSAPDQATWQALADSMTGVPFNAFMHFNQQNWKQFQAPNDTYPRPGADTPGVVSAHLSVGQVGQALLSYQLGTLNQNWGLAIFRHTVTGFTPSPNNCIAMVPLTDLSLHQYVDSPLQPGTYYYGWRVFSVNGVLKAAETETSAVVT